MPATFLQRHRPRTAWPSIDTAILAAHTPDPRLGDPWIFGRRCDPDTITTDTVDDLIERVRAHRGRLTVAMVHPDTFTHLTAAATAEQLEALTGLDEHLSRHQWRTLGTALGRHSAHQWDRPRLAGAALVAHHDRSRSLDRDDLTNTIDDLLRTDTDPLPVCVLDAATAILLDDSPGTHTATWAWLDSIARLAPQVGGERVAATIVAAAKQRHSTYPSVHQAALAALTVATITWTDHGTTHTNTVDDLLAAAASSDPRHRQLVTRCAAAHVDDAGVLDAGVVAQLLYTLVTNPHTADTELLELLDGPAGPETCEALSDAAENGTQLSTTIAGHLLGDDGLGGFGVFDWFHTRNDVAAIVDVACTRGVDHGTAAQLAQLGHLDDRHTPQLLSDILTATTDPATEPLVARWADQHLGDRHHRWTLADELAGDHLTLGELADLLDSTHR